METNITYTLKTLTLFSAFDPSTLRQINHLLGQLRTERTTSSRDILKVIQCNDIVVVLDKKSKKGTVVGMGTVIKITQLGRTFCEIRDVVVDHEHRERGLFTKLMNELERLARKKYRTERVELHSTKPLAEHLYNDRGYRDYDGKCYRKALP